MTSGANCAMNQVKKSKLGENGAYKLGWVFVCFAAGCRVRALASHQCGLGSIPGSGVICGLGLLLILYSVPRGFSPGIPVFPSP